MGARFKIASRWWLSSDEFERARETDARFHRECEESERVRNDDLFCVSITLPGYNAKIHLD